MPTSALRSEANCRLAGYGRAVITDVGTGVDRPDLIGVPSLNARIFLTQAAVRLAA